MMVVIVLLAALVPAGCVLWFLNAAMENQHLAVRQRLTDVYRSQFDARKDGLSAFWEDVDRKLIEADKSGDGGRIYELLVTGEACSAVVVRDESGKVLYPRQAESFDAGASVDSDLRDKARRLESDGKHADAAEAYDILAPKETSIHLSARAMQAQVRCLVASGSIDKAIEVVSGPLSEPHLRDAMDAEGRLIVPSAQLMALQLGGENLSPDASARLVRSLVERLWDDRDNVMPLAQRLFLIDELQAIRPQAGAVKSDSDAAMRAYRLDLSHAAVAIYLDSEPEPASGELSPAGPSDMWALASPNRRITALFDGSHIQGVFRNLCDSLPAIRDGEVTVRYNPSQSPAPEAFISEPVGPAMPGWMISLSLKTSDPFQAAVEKQRVSYLITAGVAIGLIAAIAGAIARYIGRQMKLTRLKNDLIATVSHELKTPLASMRVLIDTLVDRRIANQAQADEYLQMIARENLRLSRLIDNFLTFSRMERNKCAFEFEEVRIEELVDEAVASAGDRFAGEKSCLRVEIEPDLPPVFGDRDALVTVILNLLDNAWKYSGDDRQIQLSASVSGKSVSIEVSDNGIGMSPRTARKIFGRFFQADQTLTRSAGGCGLGLSIVKFILDAHGGSIEVASRLNSGSSFVVKLPAQSNNGGKL